MITAKQQRRISDAAFIADTPQKHEKGRGLFFIFNEDRQHFFWMKNTPIELAIIYINSDFKVVSVRKGEPFSEKTLPSIFESRYILEVNWAEGGKILPGDKVFFKMK